ncbi:MAG TPA: Ig-like domain-containing protein, partial [Kofleriaceae bacterium]|nr:Ig-like domain-containing protein [Kofleriaceae bacterium]
AEGSHTITVRGTDAAGNVGTGATTFIVDTIVPIVTVVGVPNPTNNNRPSVPFTVTGATTIQCQVDTGTFAACTSPFTPSALTDGSHTITVRGTDAAGNAGTGSTTFTVDTVAPVVTVTPVPSPTNDSTPSVSFTVTGATTIQCQVDTGSFASCTSPFTPSALTDGSHTITVRGTDAAGNSSTGATTFTVDTQAPPVAFDDTPPAQWPVNYFDMRFHTTDASATLSCSLNGSAFAACASPLTVVANYNVGSTFQVRARDAAGNTSTITATWTSIDGLVLHYPWEQGQTHNTSLLSQNSAYSPDGTVTLPVVGGWAGTAAGSPAAHTYPKTARPLSSSADGTYTASIWVRVASSSNGGTVMSTLTANNGFQLSVSGRQASLRVNEGGQAFTANAVIPQNQWVQLAVLTRGPGNGLQLLVNGNVVGTAAAPSMTGFGTGQADDLTVGTVFGVDLDDLRFYNRGLASSELCPVLLRGQLNAAGACVPLIPGFELDFENNQVRDTGRWGLTFVPPNPQLISFVTTKLGNGLRLNSSDQSFGFSAGFANQINQAPGHSFSFWFVAGANAQDTLIDFLHTCAVGAAAMCGIRVTYSTANGLTVIAGPNSPTTITKTIAVANGPHSVVVTEQKLNVDLTQSLTIYVDGVPTGMSIGTGNVYANPSDTVLLPHFAGTTIDEYEFWPRDLSVDPEMLCENGWDGEWNPVTSTCLLTSN